MKNKKITAGSASKKTKSFIKKAGKGAGKISKTIQKQWKKEQPRREKLMIAANKALKHGIKIGGDVFETIRKDLNEINNQNGKNRSKKNK